MGKTSLIMPGARPANPDSIPTRRTVLAAALALPAAALATGLPASALANTADRSAWDRAFTECQRVKALHDTDYSRFNALHDAWQAAVDAIPHVESSAVFQRGMGGHRALTTANPDDLASARRMLRGLREWGPDMDEYVAACRQIVAADDNRTTERERISEQFGINAAADRSDDLGNRQSDAEIALIKMPAPDGEALRWKMQFLFVDDGDDGFSASWSSDLIDAVMSDVDRLLVNGRA